MDAQTVADLLQKELRQGNMEVRLAETPQEIADAQALRYHVFYEEMGATPTPEMAACDRDFDLYDEVCDHLLVLDHANQENKVVGTYRLIRRAAAKKMGAFYSETEFDIANLIEYPGEILELGRSCIHPKYRSGSTMQLLWRGLAAYILRHDITLMFGCASLHGTDIKEHAVALSYLYYHHLAPPALSVKALPERYIDMRLLPPEAFDPNVAFNTLKVDARGGGNSLPPLIKGYLRVGAFLGDGAVVDKQFNTTDVFIIVKTELMTARYLRHYERAEKEAAAKS